MTTVALRTALIWHDEVMSDVVVEKPTRITLGKSGKPTFIVPELGLPANFAIVRPGNRGYLLTLGERMRGTISIDGKRRDVEEFVRHGDGPSHGGFRATPISGRDWGVIDLDESGNLKLFFQFVPLDEAPQFFTRKVLASGVAGYLLSCAALTCSWWLQGHALDEAVFRGAGMATLALAAASVVWWFIRQDSEQQASMAFSIALHGALLFTTYALYDGQDPFVWPGPRAMTGNYLVTRLEPALPPEPPEPTTVGAATTDSPARRDTPKPVKTATQGLEGASGGKGAEERARDRDATDAPPAPPAVALFTPSNRKVLDNIIDQNLSTNLGKFQGIKDVRTERGTLGHGEGTGTGVGNDLAGRGTKGGSKGTDAGGGGNVAGEFKSSPGKLDTGADRPANKCVGEGCTGSSPKPVSVAIAEGAGDFGGYTEDEINRVVKARSGVFRACYQKELNRSPGIGGKLVVRFKIGADGAVQSASNAGGSSLSNDAVESCVKSNVMRLKFPPKGAIANVTYPFVFSQGGG